MSGAGGLVRLSSSSGLDPSARVRSSGVHPQTAAIAAAADPLSRNRLRDQAGIDVIFFTACSRMATSNLRAWEVRAPVATSAGDSPHSPGAAESIRERSPA